MTQMDVVLLKTMKVTGGYWIGRGSTLTLDREHALALIRRKMAVPARAIKAETRHDRHSAA